MEDRYLFKGKEKDSGKWLEWNAIAGIPHNVTILTNTICQCTGLKDKNGRLIWENDIVNTQCGKAIVVWDKAEWRIKWIKDIIWRKDLHFWTNEYDWKCEVIGNIFDNKELLESEEK